MNIEKRRVELLEHSAEQLADQIINRDLNDLVGRYADYEEDEQDPRGHGKRVPYIGWFWRSVSFAEGYVVIGDCGEFVGFMESNKWGYPQRRLTPTETTQVLAIVTEAARLDSQGGSLADILATTKAELEKLWPLMQSFPMEVEGFWIYGPQGQVGFAESESEADQTIAALTDAAPGLRYSKVPA